MVYIVIPLLILCCHEEPKVFSTSNSFMIDTVDCERSIVQSTHSQFNEVTGACVGQLTLCVTAIKCHSKRHVTVISIYGRTYSKAVVQQFSKRAMQLMANWR